MLSIILMGVVSTSFLEMSVLDINVSSTVSLLSSISSTSILLIFILLLGAVFISVLTFNMLGLWMIQFNDEYSKQECEEDDVKQVDKTDTKVENTVEREIPKLLYDTNPVVVEKRYHEKRLIEEAPKGLYDVEVGKVERRYHEDEE